jgi:hypothetical protein
MTMAEQDSEIYRRAIKLTTFAPPEELERMKDVLDQYETLARISESQMRFQHESPSSIMRVPTRR